MKYKKADGEFWKITAAIIALVVLAVIVIIFTKFIGKEKSSIGTNIDATSEDYDCDGVKNIVDACCATPPDLRDSVNIMGCGPEPPDSKKSCSGLKKQC